MIFQTAIVDSAWRISEPLVKPCVGERRMLARPSFLGSREDQPRYDANSEGFHDLAYYDGEPTLGKVPNDLTDELIVILVLEVLNNTSMSLILTAKVTTLPTSRVIEEKWPTNSMEA
jgi:hypothetical protein